MTQQIGKSLAGKQVQFYVSDCTIATQTNAPKQWKFTVCIGGAWLESVQSWKSSDNAASAAFKLIRSLGGVAKERAA